MSEIKDFKAKIYRKLVQILEARRNRQQQKVEKMTALKTELLGDLERGEMSIIKTKLAANKKKKGSSSGLLPGPITDYI